MGKFSKSQVNWLVFVSFLLSPFVAYKWLKEKIKEVLQISEKDDDPEDNF